MKGIEIDLETAHKITLFSLIDWRDYLKKELKEWNKNPKTDTNPEGYWLHPDDVVENMEHIKALNLIIRAFGGEA